MTHRSEGSAAGQGAHPPALESSRTSSPASITSRPQMNAPGAPATCPAQVCAGCHDDTGGFQSGRGRFMLYKGLSGRSPDQPQAGQCMFHFSRFSGLWYVVSMVSDCKVFWGKKDHLLMSTREINATEEGNLSVHMEFPGADGCNQVDAEYLRTGSQGHFRVPALGYLDVRIVEMDYSSFAVVYIYKELEGAFSTMVQLYSRTQEASPQAMKAFQDFYLTVGLPDAMRVTLPKSDACSPGGKDAP
ncbi:lipocalin-15 isoform X7 [Camelus bactrianus]|uniref:Lipocalin-15 isoform X7 n=1 Tax=Camelus bactrianus TaxID=9837 RepID=A0AC58Q947_CAMBA